MISLDRLKNDQNLRGGLLDFAETHLKIELQIYVLTSEIRLDLGIVFQ